MANNISTDDAIKHAIYLRDRCECLWCGVRVVPGAPTSCPDAATQDHLVTRYAGGDDNPANITTACARCNSMRQHTPLADWLVILGTRGADVEGITRELRNRKRRKLDLEKGRRQAERVAETLERAAQMTRAMLIESVW